MAIELPSAMKVSATLKDRRVETGKIHMTGVVATSARDTFISLCVQAWQASVAGRIEESLEAYRKADTILPQGTVCPELSVMRHNICDIPDTGCVHPIPATENTVVSMVLPETGRESLTDDASLIEYPIRPVDDVIRRYIQQFEESDYQILHQANMRRQLPHTMVLSTGRCGTISLYKLLCTTDSVLPFHTYWWLLSAVTRWEMQCRLLSGQIEGDKTGSFWAATRAAEWISADIKGVPMVGLNHTDTPFAPVFAAIHPLSRFVYLRRNPEDVFASFFAKDQWREAQLRPVGFRLDPDFTFYRREYDLPRLIAWYLYFTETFNRSMGTVVGPDRFMEISSDKLFAQDREEIDKLLWFIGAKIDVDSAVKHFSQRINEKAHKVVTSAYQMQQGLESFRKAWGDLAKSH